MRESILKEIKKELEQTIKDLSLKNLSNTKAYVIQYFELLVK
ncbi:hypothetical protein [Bacillus sp. WMMC1349]|nr:hypothetical protein [Bacillus sp. WMMC1349]